MELKNRVIQTLIAVSFLVIISTSIPWYVNINKVEYETTKKKMMYDDLEASERFENYDSSKDYFITYRDLNKVERSLIPTKYKMTKIKSFTPNYTCEDKNNE